MPKKVGTENWRKKRRQEYLEMKEFRYYIFCEGEQTEPLYFSGFKKLIEDNPIYRDMVLIQIEPCGAETMRVINLAERYIKDNHIEKGQIWCVYDTVVTLNPEGYPEEKIEDTKNLVQTLEKCGIKIRLRDQMHEHFVIIDGEIVWYGSMNFLSRAKDDDNLIRLKSKDAAQELMEMTFG